MKSRAKLSSRDSRGFRGFGGFGGLGGLGVEGVKGFLGFRGLWGLAQGWKPGNTICVPMWRRARSASPDP